MRRSLRRREHGDAGLVHRQALGTLHVAAGQVVGDDAAGQLRRQLGRDPRRSRDRVAEAEDDVVGHVAIDGELARRLEVSGGLGVQIERIGARGRRQAQLSPEELKRLNAAAQRYAAGTQSR